MTQKLQASPHRLGVNFAVLVIFAGMAFAIVELGTGARREEVLRIGAYSVGIAVICYVAVRIVGWAFGELMGEPGETGAPRR